MIATRVPTTTRVSRLPVAALGSGITVLLMFVSGFGIVLAAAETAEVSRSQTMSLFIALHGLTAIMSLVLTVRYRQPLMASYNFVAFLLLMAAVGEYGYAEVSGSVLVAGVLVVLIGVLGWSTRIAALVPAPLVMALLAGVTLPFAVGVFTDLSHATTLVGSILVAYLVARRLLGTRIPAILPTLAIGLIVAAAQGDAHRFPDGWVLAAPHPELPTLSWQAVLSVSPVLVVLIAANANLATAVYLRAEGYAPPRRGLDIASGIGTMAGSLFGAVPMCLASVFAPLTAGPEAGARAQRQWSVYVAAAGLLVVALLAGMAAQLPAMLPAELLLAIAGLAVLPILGQCLTVMTSGSVKLGPLVAFVVALSELRLGGFGPLFWALVIGMAVTLVLETKGWQAMRREG